MIVARSLLQAQVFAWSASATQEARSDCTAAGMTGFLVKPLTKHGLIETLKLAHGVVAQKQ
jgi:CheY-like chemotaxis protein